MLFVVLLASQSKKLMSNNTEKPTKQQKNGNFCRPINILGNSEQLQNSE
jgi:hypothetical protein